MMRIIEERTRGTVTIAGTNWPVVEQLVRHQMPGRRPTWIVVRGLCNGIPESGAEYQTLKAARAAWDRGED